MFVGGCGVGPEIGNPATQGEVQFCRSLLLCVFIQIIGRVFIYRTVGLDARASEQRAAAARAARVDTGLDCGERHRQRARTSRARARRCAASAPLSSDDGRGGKSCAHTHAAARGTAHARCVWYRNTCPGHAQDQRLTIGDRVTINAHQRSNRCGEVNAQRGATCPS